MINLLPPELKTQLYYSKLNRTALSYLRLTIVIFGILFVIFAGSIVYITKLTNAVAADVAKGQTAIAATSAFQLQARDTSSRLSAISYIQSQQTRFSTLLSDLAKVLPKGVSINGITLTGDDKKPVRLAVTGSTYDSIVAFREAIVTSPRISAADIENITPINNGFTGSVVIAFKPGQAR